MKEILAYIEQKKYEFSQLPFFEYLRDQSISPMQRLAFAPCAAPFIMSFGELNRSVFRDESTNDPIQKIINKHTYEDDDHWLWFLEDLEKLGLNESTPFAETLKFLWSEETDSSRQLANELYRHGADATPIQKLLIISVLEATGSAFLQATSQVILELQRLKKQEYRYFGATHFTVDSNHYCFESGKQLIEEIQLTEKDKLANYELANNNFKLFAKFVDQLLVYAKEKNLNQKDLDFNSYKDLNFSLNKNSSNRDALASASILQHNYDAKVKPYQTINSSPENLTKYILERINIGSELRQRKGFLCDVIVVPDLGQDIRYYENIPVNYINGNTLDQNKHYYIVTLEFGLDIILDSPDPLAISRVHKDGFDNSDKSSEIHPVVRRFCCDRLLFEHHILEDISDEWTKDNHFLALFKFLQNNLSIHEKPLGFYLLEAGLVNSEQLKIALDEQKVTTTRLGEILSNHGWMKQKTIEYVMEKIIHKRLSGNGQRLGSYLVESGLLSSDQIEIALKEQELSHLCLGEILASYDWVSQQTIDYIMEKVVLPERQMSTSFVNKIAQKL